MTPTSSSDQPVEKILVADLPEGGRVRTYFLCAKKETPTTQKGSTYLRMTLRDASGELTAINWEPDTMLLSACEEGDVVEAAGRYKVHEKYGPQLNVDSLRRLNEGEYDPGALTAVSPVAGGELQERLRELVTGVADAPLRALLTRAIDTTREPGATFAVVPAAIRNHHAYRHGLLEHSVIVAETALRVTQAFARVDRDLLIVGALLHDVGKTRAYSADPLATGLTDEGYLLGEIVAGLEIVRGLIAETPDLSPENAELLLHIVAAHHGEREKGSPVVPQTREAVIVHYCDDMTARVAAIDEAAAKTPEGSSWTPQRVGMLGVQAYLGGSRGASDAAAASPSEGGASAPGASEDPFDEPPVAPDPEEDFGFVDEGDDAGSDEPPADGGRLFDQA